MTLYDFLQGYRSPFQMKGGMFGRFLVYFLISIFLSMGNLLLGGSTLSISLADSILYLSIYTLPVGWAFLATAVAGLIASLSYGQIPYAFVILIIKSVAVLIGKGLFTASGGRTGNGMFLSVVWCFISILSGFCCYDIVIFGVLEGLLRLMVRFLEWLVCALFAFLLLQMPRVSSIKKFMPIYRLLGWID